MFKEEKKLKKNVKKAEAKGKGKEQNIKRKEKKKMKKNEKEKEMTGLSKTSSDLSSLVKFIYSEKVTKFCKICP